MWLVMDNFYFSINKIWSEESSLQWFLSVKNSIKSSEKEPNGVNYCLEY